MTTIILDSDTFTRSNIGASSTISTGFGTASSGSSWSLSTGSGSFSIASNEGHVTSVTASTNMVLGSTSKANVEGLVRIKCSASTATRMGISLRCNGTTTFYMARLSANANTFAISKVVSGTTTDLFSTSFTVTTSSYYWIKFRAIGTTLEAKAWADGSGEPGSWTVNGTDSSISAAGTMGVTVNSSSGATTWDLDTLSFNDGTSNQTAQLRLRLQVQRTRTAQTRTRLNVLRTLTAQLRLNLSAGTLATKTGQIRARLRIQATKTGQIRARLRIQATKTGQIRARLRIQVTKTGQIRFRYPSLATKTAQIRLKMPASATKTGQIRARLRIQATKTGQIRLVLLTSSIASGGFTLFANGTGTVSYDHFRVTQYPDPALCLAPIVPQLGATRVAWLSAVPTNTTLGVDISIDGVNWTDVTSSNGGALPGLYSQPDPTIDGFDVNSASNYSSLSRTGGAAAAWAYDLANTRLAATGGTNALYLYSGLSRADVDLFVDMDQSDAGGLVWRYVDASDFYYLQVSDTLSSSGTTNTITLYKVAGNVRAQLASTSISYTVGASTGSSYIVNFTRGTFHRFRVTMQAGAIVIYVDDVQLLTYTDGAPIGAGLMGLYNNGGIVGSRYYQLWLQPLGDDVNGTPATDPSTSTCVYTRLRLATSDPSVTPQVAELVTSAFPPTIGLGTSIPSVTYTSSIVSKNLDDLAKQSNFSWYIDQNKTFIFRSSSIVAAPWILQSAANGLVPIVDLEVSGNFELDVSNDLYRNRQIILGAVDTGIFSESKIGDGSTRTFTLGNPLAAAPTIIVNGVTITSIGLKGSTGYQWYYAIGDPVIEQDSGQTVLTSEDNLGVAYTGSFAQNVTVDDTGAQAARALVEGGSGIVEAVEDHSGQNMTVAAATTLAQQLITRYAIAGRTLIFDTSRNGLAVGQTLSIFLPEHGIWNGQFEIVQVEITLQKGLHDTQIWWYKVTASELPRQDSWAKLIAAGLSLQS